MLKQRLPEQHASHDRWPKDIAEIQKRVSIDFTVIRPDVAKMTPENFTAVTQIGPNYGPREGEIQDVINAAQ